MSCQERAKWKEIPWHVPPEQLLRTIYFDISLLNRSEVRCIFIVLVTLQVESSKYNSRHNQSHRFIDRSLEGESPVLSDCGKYRCSYYFYQLTTIHWKTLNLEGRIVSISFLLQRAGYLTTTTTLLPSSVLTTDFKSSCWGRMITFWIFQPMLYIIHIQLIIMWSLEYRK